MRLRDGACGGERHRHGVLRGGADVPLGCVSDDDAVVGGGVDVDVVHADSGSADDDEVGRGRKHFVSDFGARADDERVRVGHRIEECVALTS